MGPFRKKGYGNGDPGAGEGVSLTKVVTVDSRKYYNSVQDARGEVM